jgi:hypothetical protein
MTRTALTLVCCFAAGALLAFLVAACGSSGSSSGASAGGGSLNQRSTVALRELARCVRAHGMPSFPDPQIGSDGHPSFPDSAPRIPYAIQQACRTVAAQIPADYTATTPVSTSDFQKLATLARCIRLHGVADWPDPNPLGEFPIDTRLQQGGKRLFYGALHACARLNPNPNGGINVVRAHP